MTSTRSGAWDYVTLTDSLAPAPAVIYLAVCRGSDGAARAVYGFGVALEPLATTLLRPLLRGQHLLPLPAAADSGSDTLVALSLVEPHGERAVALSTRQMRSPYIGDVGGTMLSAVGISAPPCIRPPRRSSSSAASRPARTALIAAMVASIVLLVGPSSWRRGAPSRSLGCGRTSSPAYRTSCERRSLDPALLREHRARPHARARDVHAAGRIITTETRRLMELVENLLLLGRAARETLLINGSRWSRSRRSYRDVVDGFACLAMAAEACVRIARADDVAAPVEPGAVRQILLNLLDNAVKYGPAGQTVRSAWR